MALMINDNCIGCNACPSVCPNEAITEDEPIFTIHPQRCSECIGETGEPQCMEVCPVDCIEPNPDYRETPEQLREKYDRLHH